MTRRTAQRIRMLVVQSVALRSVIVIAIGALVISALARQGDATIAFFAEKEMSLRSLQRQSPMTVAVLALVLYALACFVPGTNGKALIVGWLFGVVGGTMLINLASIFAAFAMFAISRRCLQGFFRTRYSAQLDSVDRNVRKNGGTYLLAIRLVPIAPFFAVNTLMGVSAMSYTTFWWATQLGMLPSNVAFAWLGASLPSIRDVQHNGYSELLSWQLMVPTVVLCLLPLLVRNIIKRFSWRS